MPAREHKTASDPEAKPATAHRIRLARVQGIDQIWLINLDRRPDRLEQFMQRHPEMSGRINRLSAYDGQSLELTPTLARLFAPNNFEWHKPTMGCAMSHLALWYKLAGEADENASYLILEDDALLDPSWVAKAEKAFFINSVPADWEVLFLGGILPKYRETFEKNVQPLNRMVARVNPEYVFGNNPRGYFHFCAYAYLLNKRGAQRLLELVEGGNGVWMQADFFACYTTPELSPPRPVYFTHPLLAESFQDSTQGFARPYDDGTDHSEKVDSDIWKNDQRFSPEEVAACSVDGLPLDIPGGLGLEPRPVSSPPTVAGQDSLPSSGHMVAAAPGPGAKKVGLICVTRNSAEKLKVTLDSIARNTDLGLFDLYVVDNGSSDATAEVCAGKWPDNFFFLRKNENLGWVGAINSCLHVAEKYPFIGFLHDDIEVGPRWLEHLAGILEYHKVVGAVGPLTSNERDWQGYDRFRLGPVRPRLPELAGIERTNVVEMSAAMSGFNPGITLNDANLEFFCVLIRSEIIKKTGLLDPAFNDIYLGDDDDYCQRILGSGHLLALSFNAYVAHHSGSRSLSVDNYAERYKLAQKIIADKAAKGLYEPRKTPATGARNSAAESQGAANGKKAQQTILTGLSSLTGQSCPPSVISQIWLINLERRQDRLERFKVTHPDLADVVRVLKAYDGKELQLTPKIARLFAPNDFKWNKATMGCSLSHLELWYKLSQEPDEKAVYFILEDDANLTSGWQEAVEQVFASKDIPADWDVLYLGGVLPKHEEHFVQYSEQVSGRISRIMPNGVFGQESPNRYFHFCTYAYLLSKQGAKKLLEFIRLQNGIWPQADFLLGYVFPQEYPIQLAHYFFDPLLARSYQDIEEGFVKSYHEDQPQGKMDSDIWQKDANFTESAAKEMISMSKPYDISGALADARNIPTKTPEESTGAKIAAGSEGKLIEQNLGHMVCEGHLGGFFSEGDGGTYYPLMWTHLVRKYGIRSVLDVGCGRGYSALYFQSLGCKITGIDGSEEAAATQLIGNDFVRADYSVGSSGLADGCDLVWSCEFVEHVEERFMANYLQDFRRGKYLAMTFAGPGQPGHHHVNCRPAEYWIRVLHAWGFDFLSDETTELREKARQDMEKNDQSSDKRFVYHFMHRGLFLKNTGKL